MLAVGQAHMLSPDGRCKTFNASADGYARGEGCGSAFLEKGESGPLPVVAATACNQDTAVGSRAGVSVTEFVRLQTLAECFKTLGGVPSQTLWQV